MSDTPRTDELAKRDFIPDGVWIRHARELERENAALRAAVVEFRDACFDAFFLPAPNVKPYYALVKKHAAFLPSPKPKKAKR